MAVTSSVANALTSYKTGAFGFKQLDLFATFTNSSTDYNVSGTTYTPPISSRNTTEWGQIDTNSDYTYDASVMYFPLPVHHVDTMAIEVEFLFEGIFKSPSSNTAFTARLQRCMKSNGSWVSANTQSYQFGLVAPASATNYRECHYIKAFFNYSTDYDGDTQHIIRPQIIYSGNEFRIDHAYMHVRIPPNPMGGDS